MGSLNNINKHTKTVFLDKNYVDLTAGYNIEVSEAGVFLTCDNSINTDVITDKIRLKLKNEKIKKQIVSLFVNKTDKVYRNTVISNQGIYVNDDNLFKHSNNLKCIAPLWIDKDYIPDYFIITKKDRLEDRYGNIVFKVNLYDIKVRIKEFLEETDLVNYIDKEDSIDLTNQFLYNLNGVDISDGIFKKKNISTEYSSLQTENANQSILFPYYNENNLICPNIFNFIFHFNISGFVLNDENKGLFEYFFGVVLEEKQRELNTEHLSQEFAIFQDYLDNPSYNTRNLTVPFQKYINDISFKEPIGYINHPSVRYFLNDKDDSLIPLFPKLGNVNIENNYTLITDKLNIHNLIGLSNEYIIKNINIIEGKIHSNIKLSLFKNDLKPIFSRGDYISVINTILNGDDGITDEMEWRFYACDDLPCDCVNKLGGCIQPGFQSEFETENIQKDFKSFDIYVDDYVELEENTNINFMIGGEIISSGRIYNIRNSFKNKTTAFNLTPIDETILNEYDGSKIKFTYTQKSFRYTFFNRNGSPKEVCDNIRKSFNNAFKTSIIPIDIIVENNELIFINRYAGNKYNKIFLKYCLHPSTNTTNFLLNDDYKLHKVNLGDNVFNFGKIEFTGAHKTEKALSFLTADDIDVSSIKDFSYIKLTNGYKPLNSYNYDDETIYHSNYVINNEIINGYKCFVIDNDKNGQIYTENNSVFLKKKYIPSVKKIYIYKP